MLLPAGELIFGTVNIVGQRMQISVTGIEKDGSVLAVALDAYDLDGGKGLFVPDSEERTAAKEAAASVGAGLGSSISFTTGAGQQWRWIWCAEPSREERNMSPPSSGKSRCG